MMMKKTMKLSLITIGMCCALPFCSLAAEKDPEKAALREQRAQIRSELADDRAEFDANREELSTLRETRKSLIAEIKEVRKDASVDEELKELIAQISGDIKELHLELVDSKGDVKELRASAKENIMDCDADAAKTDLKAAIATQEERIALQKSIIEKLQEKLAAFKSALS